MGYCALEWHTATPYTSYTVTIFEIDKISFYNMSIQILVFCLCKLKLFFLTWLFARALSHYFRLNALLHITEMNFVRAHAVLLDK